VTIRAGQTTRIELSSLNAVDAHIFGSLTLEAHRMGHSLLWIGFNLFVLASDALDLGVFNRRLHKKVCGSRLFSLLWVALSVLFGFGLLHYYGHQASLEFFTGT